MLYRGQCYGEPVGEWWTTSQAEATSFAMSRGGNRTWVVLAIDEEPTEAWLVPFLMFERAGDQRGNWYRIPLIDLRVHWRGVRIVDGAIDLGAMLAPS